MSGRDPRDIVLQPVVSEKSYAAYDSGVYTFLVAPDANNIEIGQAIEAIFNVKVKNVPARSSAAQRSGHTGGRFSTNACMPSRAAGCSALSTITEVIAEYADGSSRPSCS